MASFWELWDTDTANLIADFDTESEALACVRDLIGKGWPIAYLSLVYEDSALADEELPPGVHGEELARRAEAAGNDPVRRTA